MQHDATHCTTQHAQHNPSKFNSTKLPADTTRAPQPRCQRPTHPYPTHPFFLLCTALVFNPSMTALHALQWGLMRGNLPSSWRCRVVDASLRRLPGLFSTSCVRYSYILAKPSCMFLESRLLLSSFFVSKRSDTAGHSISFAKGRTKLSLSKTGDATGDHRLVKVVGPTARSFGDEAEVTASHDFEVISTKPPMFNLRSAPHFFVAHELDQAAANLVLPVCFTVNSAGKRPKSAMKWRNGVKRRCCNKRI